MRFLERFYCYQCEMWIEFAEDMCLECFSDRMGIDYDEDDYSDED